MYDIRYLLHLPSIVYITSIVVYHNTVLFSIRRYTILQRKRGRNQAFFKNIIGVTHEKGAKVERVVIRTKTEYQHGLLLTKPLHHSQEETLPYGQHEEGCYGEVMLTIEPNRELRGKILMYGKNLEVMQPQSLREQIKEVLKKQLNQYLGTQ